MKPNFEKGDGLLPAIAQDWQTGQVLMLAFMNLTAWEKTLETWNDVIDSGISLS